MEEHAKFMVHQGLDHMFFNPLMVITKIHNTT